MRNTNLIMNGCLEFSDIRGAFHSTKNFGNKFRKFGYTSWGFPNVPEFQTGILVEWKAPQVTAETRASVSPTTWPKETEDLGTRMGPGHIHFAEVFKTDCRLYALLSSMIIFNIIGKSLLKFMMNIISNLRLIRCQEWLQWLELFLPPRTEASLQSFLPRCHLKNKWI